MPPDAELLPTALYLIQRGYWCALYELYIDAKRTGALAADDAARLTLHKFFTDSQRFPAQVLRAVRETFDSGVSAARVIDAESRAAVAEYDLRIARDDLARHGKQSSSALRARDDADGTRAAMDADDAFGAVPRADASMDASTSTQAHVDTDTKLDAACYEFLSRRGFRAAALAMRDESPTAATLDEQSFGKSPQASSVGERAALRRMYDRARVAEHTAAALESERARSDAAESELVRARARVDELEREITTLRDEHATVSDNLAKINAELNLMKTSSSSWEKRANAATSEMTRLLSRLGAETDAEVTASDDWTSIHGGAPRTTIEEDETIDVCLNVTSAVVGKLPASARLELLPMISRACARAAGDATRATRAANMFFEMYKKPNEDQRLAIANAIANVGEVVGVDAFDGMFSRGCLSAETSTAAAHGDERRVLTLDVVAKLGSSLWYTSNAFIIDSFKRGAADPSDDVRAECARGMSRYIAARAPSDATAADVAEDVALALASDGSEDVADAARLDLAPAIAEWYLSSQDASAVSMNRFTDVFAPKLFNAALAALESGWSGAGAERAFTGWSSPEEADRMRWRASATMRMFESMMPTIRGAIERSAPEHMRGDPDAVDVALANDAAWPLATWCVNDASRVIVRIISSAAPDVVGQESVRESMCAALTSWCKVVGPRVTRSTLIDELNEACVVSRDQRAAVLPLLLAGVVPNTPNGDDVLEDYLKRLIEVEAPKVLSDVPRSEDATTSDIMGDAARYLAALERHNACLLRTLKRCAKPDNETSVRLLTTRLFAATSEVLPTPSVLEDVYPTLNALRADAAKYVRCESALALASVACSHYESVDATTHTMRQLEILAADVDIDVRVAVVAAMSRGASVPGTTFAVSAANAVSALAQANFPAHDRTNRKSFTQDDCAMATALFAAARELLGADGALFAAVAPALVALLGGESAHTALDQAHRAQVETMLRDGGWQIAPATPAEPIPASIPTRQPPPQTSSAAAPPTSGSVFGRMKSKLARAPRST